MSRALLLHLDGKLPNVALMRIAAHRRARGDEVVLRRVQSASDLEPEWGESFDVVYASAIFERTRPLALRVLRAYPNAVIGGTGVNFMATLEGDLGITTLAQDYSVYPGFEHSIGFTQRGCRLACPFCVVPIKEGRVRAENTVASLWRGEPHPRNLLLLDNDFFGNPGWRELVAAMRAGGFRVCFSQGINARLINAEVARAIASLDYRDDQFKTKRIYAAWDNRADEQRLFAGLTRLRDAGVKPDHMMVYMLIGYWAGETHDDREYRRQRLRDFGARPYPMAYGTDSTLKNYQRWVIGAFDKSFTWAEWQAAHGQPRNLVPRAQRMLPMVDR